MLTPILAIVRKDLQLFSSDRRAVIMAIAVPIVIASFFGAIFSGQSNTGETRIPILIVDEDSGPISRAIVEAVSKDANLTVTTATAADARATVQRGDAAVAVIVPKGFGDAAGRAFFSRDDKPQLQLLYDPSQTAERAMVRGILTGHVTEAVSREMFTGERGRQLVDETLASLDTSGMPADQARLLRDLLNSVKKYSDSTTPAASAPGGIAVPFTTKEDAVTARQDVAYNGYAHSFAGMGVQFILFAAIDLGVGILLERQRGLWKRLRSAPVSRFQLLAGKVLSGTVIGMLSLIASFAFAIIVWGVRIDGSVVGFLAVGLAFAVMAAAFGLLLAALGNTPSSTRGVAILVTLVMVMLGGAWVPTFVFPAWLQRMTVIMPTRWAVDGLDAMTWRGIGAGGAVTPVLVMLGFAAAFTTVAIRRFRWEEA
jgi:ABC-2 type transport system permease protein